MKVKMKMQNVNEGKDEDGDEDEHVPELCRQQLVALQTCTVGQVNGVCSSPGPSPDTYSKHRVL